MDPDQDHPPPELNDASQNVHNSSPTGLRIMNLPSPPHSPRLYQIRARNLWYKIDQVKSVIPWKICGERRVGKPCFKDYVLKNIHCQARAGQILAIAGPSGAGKSTLLELLAGRLRPTSPSDSILVNEEPMDRNRFRRISGYVTQDDALLPLLTVKETLQYSARLRLPSTMSTEDKLALVKALIGELGLEHVADSRIGNEELRGLSGGERRRVSIGVDVIHDPAILLLDEPTSGLDSAGALQVISMLKSMAKIHSRTIVLSIHQPGFRILQMINSVVLLANGAVVHHGSLQQLQWKLEGIGHVIPAQVNVLEYAIDTIDSLEEAAKSMEDEAKSTTTTTDQLSDLEASTATGSDLDIQVILISSPEVAKITCRNDRPCFANSSMQEVIILASRYAQNIIRTKQLFAARTLQALLAGFCLGTIFLKVQSNVQGIQERIGFFAFTLTFLLSSTTEGLPIFLQERRILLKETSRGAYRVSSYVLANTIVFLPFLLLVAALYTIPVYWLVGLSSSWSAFLFFFLVLYLVVLMANSFVACFSALVPNYIMGNSLIAGCMGAFFLFSGYFISKDNIPVYWTFLHYLSLFKYPFEALLINEFSSAGSKCLVSLDVGVCSQTGNGVLRDEGLSNTSKWMSVAVMLAFVFVYRLLCYLILRSKVYNTRR